MKTNEAILCLEAMIKILRAFPDMEVHEALGHVSLAVKDYVPKKETGGRKGKADAHVEITDDMIKELAGMSVSELGMFMRTSPAFSSRAGLQHLTQRLGLASSQRQSYDALLNMVLKHYEARRMDVLIRSQRTQDNVEPDVKK